MSEGKKILRPLEKPERGDPSNHPDYMFWCPGCGCGHGIWTTKRNSQSAIWEFNGNMEKPTFQPSLLVTGTKHITDDERDRIIAGEKIEPVPTVCHSYVRDGKIQYLPDCTHELAGKTIPMEPF